MAQFMTRKLPGAPRRRPRRLPPVAVGVPDDAGELDRGVQAYQRELRPQRRRQRASRLRGPLTRDGMVLPLLAGCLILALITSTLLIMFAADQTGMPFTPGHSAAGPGVNAVNPHPPPPTPLPPPAPLAPPPPPT